MSDKKINYAQRKACDFNILTRLYQYYALYILFLPFFGTLFYKFHIKRNKNIENKPYIIAPNHISYMDVFIVNYAFGRPLAYMAKQELFDADNILLRTLVRWLGAFAVNRDKPEIATFKTVNAVFNTKDWALGIFPQGGIRKDSNKIENIHKGFTLFAKKFKADIIPVAICGYDGYAKKLFEKHLTMKIGKPISYQLPEDEIVRIWVKQICEFTGLEPGDEYKNIEDKQLNTETAVVS